MSPYICVVLYEPCLHSRKFVPAGALMVCLKTWTLPSSLSPNIICPRRWARYQSCSLLHQIYQRPALCNHNHGNGKKAPLLIATYAVQKSSLAVSALSNNIFMTFKGTVLVEITACAHACSLFLASSVPRLWKQVGYGDVSPKNNLERCVAMGIMITGRHYLLN